MQHVQYVIEGIGKGICSRLLQGLIKRPTLQMVWTCGMHRWYWCFVHDAVHFKQHRWLLWLLL